MKTTPRLYTAEELRQLPLIDEEAAEALEKISDGAYIAAAQGRRFIICIVDKNIVYKVKQKLHALGYRVLVMEDTKPDDDRRAGQGAGRWVELRVEWA